MGALAALKARTVVENAAHVVAIELVCAAQGLEFHRPLRSDRRARRRGSRACGRTCRASRRTARWRASWRRWPTALRSGELTL